MVTDLHNRIRRWFGREPEYQRRWDELPAIERDRIARCVAANFGADDRHLRATIKPEVKAAIHYGGLDKAWQLHWSGGRYL